MEWEVQEGESTRGPLTDEQIVDAIRGGLAPTTKARPVGTEKWRPIGAHEPFAAALQVALAAHRSNPVASPRAPWWLPTSLGVVVVASLVTATFAVLVFVQVRTLGMVAGERMPSIDNHLQSIEQMDRTRATTEFVTSDKTEINCIATNTDITCSATNRTAGAVQTCVRGKLAKKQANAITVYSLPLCTGRLDQFQTRSVSAPWKGAFAKDLCSSKTAYGNEILDWNECDFSTEPVGAL